MLITQGSGTKAPPFNLWLKVYQ